MKSFSRLLFLFIILKTKRKVFLEKKFSLSFLISSKFSFLNSKNNFETCCGKQYKYTCANRYCVWFKIRCDAYENGKFTQCFDHTTQFHVDTFILKTIIFCNCPQLRCENMIGKITINTRDWRIHRNDHFITNFNGKLFNVALWVTNRPIYHSISCRYWYLFNTRYGCVYISTIKSISANIKSVLFISLLNIFYDLCKIRRETSLCTQLTLVIWRRVTPTTRSCVLNKYGHLQDPGSLLYFVKRSVISHPQIWHKPRGKYLPS